MNQPQSARTAVLKIFVDTYFGVTVTMLRMELFIEVEDKEMLVTFYKKHCDNKEEGIMIKIMGAPYEPGSRRNWWKVKPIFENTMKVTGFEPGEGRHKGKVGALLVEDKEGRVKCKVGSGLTDYDREEFVENLPKFIDVAYNEITSNKKGEYSLRNPRFLKTRIDKDEADIIVI
jgi:DNA ligase-1